MITLNVADILIEYRKEIDKINDVKKLMWNL